MTVLQLTRTCLLVAAVAAPGDYFKIEVVDEATGRGVPCIELKTVSNVRYYTDSAGVVAFHEPGLMGKPVFFHVSGHGYEFPKDGFGYRGRRLQVEAGASVTLKVKRVNIAERLYRVTGAGIYRDSVLVGDEPPTAKSLLNGDVFGSDSVLNAVYRGKIYWFWGDTNRPSYPLGNFHVPGATSLLPDAGGLAADAGVDLNYFVKEDGFAKETAKMPGQGPTWLDGLTVVKSGDGVERMFAKYVKIKPPLEVYERGLAEWNDEAKQFEKRTVFPPDTPLFPEGHPLVHEVDGTAYVYFANPYPVIRVEATAEALQDLSSYEAFTCLKDGGRADRFELDRDDEGNLQFRWRTNTAPLSRELEERLIKEGRIKRSEGLHHVKDVETGERIAMHRGSVYWNAHRQRFVMIFCQVFGTSLLGEVWYAEAVAPEGPWRHARKIVTHDKYSFYNPKQHPMFDQDGGRVIFFEGTYTTTFSGNDRKTPRYDYNQIMYRLELDDPRLKSVQLPASATP